VDSGGILQNARRPCKLCLAFYLLFFFSSPPFPVPPSPRASDEREGLRSPGVEIAEIGSGEFLGDFPDRPFTKLSRMGNTRTLSAAESPRGLAPRPLIALALRLVYWPQLRDSLIRYHLERA